MKYIVFDLDYLDICLEDMPDKDDLIVCRDPQKRLTSLNDETWAVVKAVSDRGGDCPNALALFWDKDVAVKYAKMLCKEYNGTLLENDTLCCPSCNKVLNQDEYIKEYNISKIPINLECECGHSFSVKLDYIGITWSIINGN